MAIGKEIFELQSIIEYEFSDLSAGYADLSLDDHIYYYRYEVKEGNVEFFAAANSGIKINEYTPLQIKQAVVGYGRADKNQVQQMVKVILKLDKIIKPDDAADAVAIAISHAYGYRGAQKI